MKITKEDAIALTKVLSPHTDYFVSGDRSDYQLTLVSLQERCTEFLLDGPDDDEGDEEAADEDDEDDEGDDEEEQDEDEEEDPTDGSDEDDESEEDVVTCSGDELHLLTVAKSKQGEVEFEVVSNNEVDLLLGGYTEIRDITHLKRGAKSLSVSADGSRTWTAYHVSRFPKGWAALLPLDVIVEVE
jgi:nitrous oxide reductase